MPSSVFRSTLAALTITAALMMAPAVASAAKGDCGQPATSGASATATDCLYILKAAVGAVTCDPTCICNVNDAGGITATDALTCLKKAVGQDVVIDCGLGCGTTTTTTLPPDGCEANVPVGCPAKLDTCTSANFVSQTNSDLDTGWNGLAHNQDLVGGATISIDIVRRCVNNKTTICKVDSDCPSGDTCRPFCDCDDPNNSICDITGPTHERRCVKDLAPCTTNADCGAGVQCEHFFGPPLPTSAANTPACITSYFQEDLSGTADSQTGEGRASAFLRSRVHLGVASDKPCPACGLPGQNPVVGQQYTCSGGPKNGAACTVEAVSPTFGGVSSSCPPDSTTNVSGVGLAIRFREVTTGTTERTAEIPCLFSGGCVDGLGPNNGQCATNADCTRCTNDLSACSSNADCSGGATCAAAPDQPISCGLYCQCGFCNNNPEKPCFNVDDCDAGETCEAGDNTTGQQDQPNGCSDLVCGRVNPEECCNSEQDGSACPQANSTGLSGKCSLKSFVACSTDPSSDLYGACAQQNGGDCVASARPCFGSKITRTGEPSPLGKYCVDDPSKGVCSSNADCATGSCVADTSEPKTVALFCVPKTTSAAINAAGGIPGPGAITFNSVIFACRCGDGKVGCNEQCDDGNNTNGDGCDQACRLEP